MLYGRKEYLLIAVALIAAVLLFPSLGSAARLTYPHDTYVNIPKKGIKLKILRGSSADRVTKGDYGLTVELSEGQKFTLRYPGPKPGHLKNDKGFAFCNVVEGDNEVVVYGPDKVVFTPEETFCEHVEEQKYKYGNVKKTAIQMFSPDGGEELTAGEETLIIWSAALYDPMTVIKVWYSTDSEETYTLIGEKYTNDGYFSWSVPDEGSMFAYVKVQIFGYNDILLAEDVSRDKFTIVGSELEIAGEKVAREEAYTEIIGDLIETEAAAPVVDETVEGPYDVETAETATPTVNVDRALPTVYPEETLCTAGTVFKGTEDTVYYCARDGYRYVFPHRKVYMSWFKDFSHVIPLSDATVGKIQIGGNVTYKPGSRLIKTVTDPKVYAVSRGGTLRHVKDEGVAERIYGTDWAKKVDDISDAFFADYSVGEQITESEEPEI